MTNFKSLAVLALSFVASQASAATITCGTFDRELLVQVQAAQNATIMTLADPTAPQGQQVLARFSDVSLIPASGSATIMARVHSHEALNPAYISTTPVSQIRMVELKLQFGVNLQGNLVVTQQNGAEFHKAVSCVRQ